MSGELSILNYEPGIHHRVPPEIYHQRHRGLVSKTALDLVNKAPLFYDAWLKETLPEPESAAMDFGGLFHCALLEPDRYASEYIVEPDFGDCRKKENKAQRDEWRRVNVGKKPIEAGDEDAVRGMIASIRRHPLASRILSEGEPEVTMRWQDPDTGLQCKARADYRVAARKMVADVKTADDAGPEAFRRSIVKYRYHVQDALYRAAFGAIGQPIEYFVFVVVEKKAPYAVATYTLDSEGIQRGYAHATRNIATLAECVRNNDFPGYPMTIQVLELPPWAA